MDFSFDNLSFCNNICQQNLKQVSRKNLKLVYNIIENVRKVKEKKKTESTRFS